MKEVVLGIETSCDECSIALVKKIGSTELKVLSNITYSQIDLHRPYGGVVPEIASRNHLETIHFVLDRALRESGVCWNAIDAISVTNRPGLVGALLVGVSAAKAMAYAHQKELYAIHHLEGHSLSVFLDQKLPEIKGPLLVGVISGGHTNLYVVEGNPIHWKKDWFQTNLIASSLDDAAGEAFDKTAKLMGLPYPGGVWIDENARKGDPKAFHFPRALKEKSNLNFSFSGLKTAVALEVQKIREKRQLEERRNDLCASVQEAIVDVLLRKISFAMDRYRCQTLVLVGGVAANSRLRERLASEFRSTDIFSPLPQYCTDNGAMIAAVPLLRSIAPLKQEELLTLNAFSSGSH